MNFAWKKKKEKKKVTPLSALMEITLIKHGKMHNCRIKSGMCNGLLSWKALEKQQEFDVHL
jgi:hypothetical protein